MSIELLAPAGNLEKAKTAILYGADAVYIGGQEFSLRSRASNFSIDEIAQLCQFAHEHGSHVHVTVNMIPHPDDLHGLTHWLQQLDEAGVDAIIAASPAIFRAARALNPKFEIHLSTQHSVVNAAGVQFWKEQKADRVVLGRECTLEQIEEICQANVLPIEAFIHGGMCIGFSGRCTLSNHMTNRDANRGGCAQSCRWKYEVSDGDEVISSPEVPFSMSSRDLQGVEFVEPLMKAGCASLKIEGRMKSSYYLATVVSSYRRLIDHIEQYGHADPEFLETIKTEIAKAENRPTACGFFKGAPGHDIQLYRSHDETVTQEYVGLVLDVLDGDWLKVQVRNKFLSNAPAEIFGPSLLPVRAPIRKIVSLKGELLDAAIHPMDIVYIQMAVPAQKGAMIRLSRTD